MRIIKKLDIYILKNFMTLFAGTFCISLFAVMMQFLWKYVNELVGKGLGTIVIAKFFFYAAETMVPMALPLAILLASLISFGNLGERFELLAIKASGVSLWRTMQPLLVMMSVLAGVSFYFQNVVTPEAENQVLLFRYSIMQKSPELDIPEGVFYDGISGINLYVKQKDKQTGMLYDVVIYNLRDGVDNAHIILADSAHLETSADKRSLLLQLYSGEQFENMRGGALITKVIPYRRETFIRKDFIIDFDTNLDMADAETFSGSARTKRIEQLLTGIDSLRSEADSLAHGYYRQMQQSILYVYQSNPDSIADIYNTPTDLNIDTMFAHLNPAVQQGIVRTALSKVNGQQMDADFKATLIKAADSDIRMHEIRFWQKFTLAFTCLVFFFIGAPLGAIIRKGGLGLPVVVAVVIFIAYYIIDIGGEKMAKVGTIPVLLGKWLSTIVLAPIGAFLTIKSNNDSVVFNLDSYKTFFNHLLGIPQKRHLYRKEVIIYDPDYPTLAKRMANIAADMRAYRKQTRRWHLLTWIIEVVKNQRDPRLTQMADELEACVEELSNARDRQMFIYLNQLPVISLEPRFHNRLRRELKQATAAADKIVSHIQQILKQ